MISIDIDGPSTMLNSICESIVITQGTVYTSSAPKPTISQSIQQPVSKNIFDHRQSPLSRLRHVVVDQHEEYLLDSSRTPTPSTKKDKVEVIDTWQDRTVIDGGASSIWRSPSLLQTHRANKHVESSTTIESFTPPSEPQFVQQRYVPSHDVKYRTEEQINIPSNFNWNEENIQTPVRSQLKTQPQTRDVALSPILPNRSLSSTNTSTSPIPMRDKVDRSCQYSPPMTQELASQCRVDQQTMAIQVFPHEIPHLLISQGGTQTTQEMNKTTPTFDDSGIQGHLQTVSPSLSAASSSETQPTSSSFVLTGPEFIRKLNDQRAKASSALTVTQFTDGHHYLPLQQSDSTGAITSRSTQLERSADSGILVDDHLQQVC